MPFQSVTALPADPLAKIFFTGQLIFDPSNDTRTCEVFVNRGATNHELLIEVRLKRPVGPDIILLRQQGRINQVLGRHGMLIEFETGAASVKRYDGPDVPATGVSPFGHVLNLTELYLSLSPPDVPNLEPDPSVAAPSIRLNEGVFYSASRADPGSLFELGHGGTFVRDLSGFTHIVGVDIPRIGNNPLIITWRPQGSPEQLALRPLTEAGFSYEIYVINDPPFEPAEDPTRPPHDEFREYFKALTRVPPHRHLSLTPKPTSPPGSGPGGQRGSTRTPCMPVTRG